jgi:DNA polymerase III delta prime subunit
MKENKENDDIMDINYEYPDNTDDNLQEKIYKKREFYFHKADTRPDITNYEEIKQNRKKNCIDKFSLRNHQYILSNFINPNTPYKGIILFHGLGSGKCIDRKSNIQIHVNNVFYNYTIENIWNIHSNIITYDEIGEWSIPKSDIYVDSYDEKENKIKKNKIKKMYRQKINEYVKKIILDDATITTSLSHKLLTKNGWKYKINVCDYIGCLENNNIIYKKIKNIIYKKYINEYIYDFEIEQSHNYVANNIICHNTCAAITIAENFKSMVQKYNTKIYILTSGPIIKENWKSELMNDCTGDIYLKKQQYINDAEKNKQINNAMNNIMQYYRFLSYKGFYKRVLGEKMIEKKVVIDTKTKVTYKKNIEGEYERDIVVDKIYNLNNSIIIVDEAHNLTGNVYGESLQYIIKKSHNLRVILLTATPMKNLADDIVKLVNFIRPIDSPMEREKIFSIDKNYDMEIKKNGIEYFKNMAKGYISYVRGNDPILFAKRIDKGVIPDGLLFTKVIKCKMLEFQRNVYDEVVKNLDDTLDRRSESAANFVFPCLDEKKENIIGVYGKNGMDMLMEQLKNYEEKINDLIIKNIIGKNIYDKDDNKKKLIYLTNNKQLSGDIFNLKYLKYFSTKFYCAMMKLNKTFAGKKGPSTSFVYSNLVKVGIDIFYIILINNGYLEYQKDFNTYNIMPNTICYYCGIEKKNHNNEHKFYPATFVPITGKSNDDYMDVVVWEKHKILKEVFNNNDNIEGKHIKLVIGSKVINEGINMKNVASVHILDVYFNLGRVDQVIGRAIRQCSHYKITNEHNKFPKVATYKYVVSIDTGLSTEEHLYKKAEKKYMTIKTIERAMKEIAIDCPLNYENNIFKEEIKEYENCIENVNCPVECDYLKCTFICEDKKLNATYYDPNRKIYKILGKNEIDYSTFTNDLARKEINFAKTKIKQMYLVGYVYSLEDIINNMKIYHEKEKQYMYDDFFIYKAIDEFMPFTENDFNNYYDIIVDKYNRQGYLIYRNKYYIFQPFEQHDENVPMDYRINYAFNNNDTISLASYLKLNVNNDNNNNKEHNNNVQNIQKYNEIIDYYQMRDEYDIVGIIDYDDKKNIVFKIRQKREKNLNKKRGVDIPSVKGAICEIAKDKKYLIQIAEKLDIDTSNKNTRNSLCEQIKNKMLFLEKYAINTKKNKLTYVMILPDNHPDYPFPYNLEDRVDYIKYNLKNIITHNFDIHVSIVKENTFVKYVLTIANSDLLKKYEADLQKFNFKFNKKNNNWLLLIE